MDWGEILWSMGYEILKQTAGGTPGSVPGQPGGMSYTGSGPTMPGANPTGATFSNMTSWNGKRRRRRRRLLTPTDLSDLAALKTIVGNSDALKFAVTKAVRR